MKILSVVFSFRNEENNLDKLIDRVDAVFKKLGDWEYELILPGMKHFLTY